MNKLILYFNFENSFFEYHLPAINQREFQLDLGRYLPEYPCVIQFETIDGKWYIKDSKDIDFSVEDANEDYSLLLPGTLIYGKSETFAEQFAILVLEEDSEVANYNKYLLSDKDEFVIGRNPQSDIVIDDDHVSQSHATIIRKHDGIYINDTSKNGTFLNGTRIIGKNKLVEFDEILLLELKS